jgi:hypothetical protein
VHPPGLGVSDRMMSTAAKRGIFIDPVASVFFSCLSPAESIALFFLLQYICIT